MWFETIIGVITANLMLFSLILFFVFLSMFVFFIIGWKLAAYKNRDRFRWGLIIGISGAYGVAALAALPKIEREEHVEEPYS